MVSGLESDSARLDVPRVMPIPSLSLDHCHSVDGHLGEYSNYLCGQCPFPTVSKQALVVFLWKESHGLIP